MANNKKFENETDELIQLRKDYKSLQKSYMNLDKRKRSEYKELSGRYVKLRDNYIWMQEKYNKCRNPEQTSTTSSSQLSDVERENQSLKAELEKVKAEKLAAEKLCKEFIQDIRQKAKRIELLENPQEPLQNKQIQEMQNHVNVLQDQLVNALKDVEFYKKACEEKDTKINEDEQLIKTYQNSVIYKDVVIGAQNDNTEQSKLVELVPVNPEMVIVSTETLEPTENLTPATPVGSGKGIDEGVINSEKKPKTSNKSGRSSSKNRRDDVKSCTKSRPYKCPTCSQKYSRIEKLNAHIHKRHDKPARDSSSSKNSHMDPTRIKIKANPISMDSSTNQPSSGWELFAFQNALEGISEHSAVDFDIDEEFMSF